MPYQAGSGLPGERASKLGHLEIINNPLVSELIGSFKEVSAATLATKVNWQPLPMTGEPLSVIFGVDGSYQVITTEKPPFSRLAFVKTALLRLDQPALAKLDKESPNPFALRDIMRDNAMYHATAFPLRYFEIPNQSLYNALRWLIYKSLKDDTILEQQPYETLKWLIYRKWDKAANRDLPPFDCPLCGRNTTLPFDADIGKCNACKTEIYVTDYLGLHREMTEDAASEILVTSYMNLHETLMLFTGIHYYWENNKSFLSNCLFVKDGPLAFYQQLYRLTDTIRFFLEYAKRSGVPVHIISQEKSGRFFDHLKLVGPQAPTKSLFIPNDKYIKEHIQFRPDIATAYGSLSNFGAKVFVSLSDYHKLVLNIPTGQHLPNPSASDLIGAARIFATLPTILSSRYESGMLPIELANGIASLATYPSAKILRVFAGSKQES